LQYKALPAAESISPLPSHPGTLQAREFKDDLGHRTAPPLERALIQHAALCWLRLSIMELRYTNVMRQSITLTLGAYWEKRLTAAQKEVQPGVRVVRAGAEALAPCTQGADQRGGRGWQQVNVA
jgi:hypothetical protein